jgi:hypothetical protein
MSLPEIQALGVLALAYSTAAAETYFGFDTGDTALIWAGQQDFVAAIQVQLYIEQNGEGATAEGAFVVWYRFGGSELNGPGSSGVELV